MYQSVKARIYPTDAQSSKLSQFFGCARWWWNRALNETTTTYAQTGKGLSREGLNALLPALKKEFDWLSECHSQVLQSVTLNLTKAFINFFEKRAKYPNFKSKHGKQSIQYPQGTKFVDNLIYLPKLGWVKISLHRPLDGEVKTVTISKNPSGQYFAAILTEQKGVYPAPSREGNAIGIDLGITDFAIASTGSKYPNPRHIKKHESNLKRKQRKLSRKVKGSNSRNKARKLVARVHQRISNSRQDFLHKLSAKLVNENQVIVVEDLAVKNMVRNHCLAKAISDCGWSSFVGMLNYKCERSGKILVKVDRFFPSSKTCSNCYHRISSLPLDVRQWTCSSCGTHHDRDVNAAQNLKAEGLRILSLGTSETADGGNVRPSRGRKTSVRRSPSKSEARSLSVG
ncbi:RNA-guided endonuclease TnpB family protein [Chamaesiphon sp. VAR_69_metabat_338]|uniref:RNA-guided endonuclease InsQ/TnpB family protein n=1 Tax=Chamaesiphon sp. VAR_69_metabat_338 TaxID=2964704 RepID=UPI00286E9840|nr:RNA-guided endonuclease TnpB family protein [Chamaesiphon sp. VAR_69_metabat_338]